MTDLHRDFVSPGPLARPGSDGVAASLAELVGSVLEAGRRSTTHRGYRAAFVAVEGEVWGFHQQLPDGCGLPAHGNGDPANGLAAGLRLSPHQRFVWASCPACGTAPLSAQAEGGGQSFSLDDVLSRARPSVIEVAGLSVEHAGLAVAMAAAVGFGSQGTLVEFRADLSTFLDPAEAADRLTELSGVGVNIVDPR